MRSHVKLYQLNNKEGEVKGKESRRHKNTPAKNKKGPIGASYQKDKKVRERAAKRRTESLKLKVKELRVVTGKHAKLELFDEDENHKPVPSSRQVYATSTDILSHKVHQAVLHHQVQITKQQQKDWDLAFTK